MERTRRILQVGGLVTLVSLAASLGIGLPAHARDKDVLIEKKVKIPMRDGTHLVAYLHKPAEMTEPLPLIFMMDPYNANRWGDRGRFYVKHGYVLVAADVRGCGQSPGTFRPFEPDGQDGYDAIEWLAKQPYCNGKIGMRGGSYQGWVQWTILKGAPPALKTIIPVVSTYPGTEGIPKNRNMMLSYVISWLESVKRKSGQPHLKEDIFLQKKCEMYRKHIPFAKFGELHGKTYPQFDTWIKHPAVDSYYDAMNPTPEQYARMNIPILTITGHFDADQTGSMLHYRRHLKNAPPEAGEKHCAVIGPWTHGGVFAAKKGGKNAGIEFGKASRIDTYQLSLEWFNWTLKDGPRPAFLKKNFVYYVMGTEQWKYADNLYAIPSRATKWYLDSGRDGASSISKPGILNIDSPSGKPSDTYTYDPLDTRPGEMEIAEGDESGSYNIFRTNAFSQRYARSVSKFGHGLIYESAPLTEETEISGYAKLVAWISMDVPDTDLMTTIHEVLPDGTCIQLTDDALRARYRLSPRKAVLATPGKIHRYEFSHFWFFSRVLKKDSRLRLVFMSPNSIHLEKNYNGGGVVAEESAKDARTARITLHHDGRHASFLELPVVPRKAEDK